MPRVLHNVSCSTERVSLVFFSAESVSVLFGVNRHHMNLPLECTESMVAGSARWNSFHLTGIVSWYRPLRISARTIILLLHNVLSRSAWTVHSGPSGMNTCAVRLSVRRELRNTFSRLGLLQERRSALGKVALQGEKVAMSGSSHIAKIYCNSNRCLCYAGASVYRFIDAAMTDPSTAASTLAAVLGAGQRSLVSCHRRNNNRRVLQTLLLRLQGKKVVPNLF
mmetsp:Transcript_72431/g.120741  ORF Transcript_72431/g.120741 Transcript_72431/m.120741 type:complete len:223 (+) Transcript_72431:214-882(+)